MSATFDPYHRWLSIPPSKQPPHHYRLLGLQEFESTVEVIENAADRQMGHVRPHLHSPLRPYAVNLIRELDVARKCLLDPEAKIAYDAWLEQCIGYEPDGNGVHTRRRIDQHDAYGSARQAATTGIPPSAGGFIPVPSIASRSKRRVKSQSNVLTALFLWLIGGVIGLLAGYAVLCMIDPKYDFLHVMFPEQVQPPIAVGPSSPSPPSAHNQKQSPFQKSAVTKGLPPKPWPRKDIEAARAEVTAESNRIAASDNPLPRRLTPYNPRTPQLNVPDVLPLPPRTSRSTDKPTLLTILFAEGDAEVDVQKLEISLTQGSNAIAGKLLLEANDAGSNKEPSWVVRWWPAAADPGNHDDPAITNVGTFSIVKNLLCFDWSADVPRPAASAIRNSVLQLRLDAAKHLAALRAPERLDSASFDLNRGKLITVFKCDDMPELENVRIDVDAGTRLPSHIAAGTGLKGLKLNDETVVWYQQAKGVATSIKLAKRGKRPVLEIGSGFTLPSGHSEALTIAALADMRGRLQIELNAAKAYQLAPRNREKLKLANNTITQCETDLSALMPIEALAQQLHNNVKLPIRFYIDVDGHEVVLAKSD